MPAPAAPVLSPRMPFLPRLKQIWTRTLPARTLLMFRKRQTTSLATPLPFLTPLLPEADLPLYFLADPETLSGEAGTVLLTKMAEAIGMTCVGTWKDPAGQTAGLLCGLKNPYPSDSVPLGVRRPPILLVFGLEASRWVSLPCFSETPPRMVATHSLSDLFHHPALKRDTWRVLKAIAAQLGQTLPSPQVGSPPASSPPFRPRGANR
jgi:hypothetical protein